MIKKYIKRLSIISFLLVACVIGSTYAYMFRQTPTIENQFNPSYVDCKVEETYLNNQKSSIKIKNTGNIDAYLRVRFVTYWINSEGNIVGKKSELPTINANDNWIKGSNDTYYYKYVVSPNENYNNSDLLLGELLKSPITLSAEDGYQQVVEVFAEAIQANPSNSAASSWNVIIDGNTITTVN